MVPSMNQRVESSSWVVGLVTLVVIGCLVFVPSIVVVPVAGYTNASPIPTLAEIVAKDSFVGTIGVLNNNTADELLLPNYVSYFPNTWTGTSLPQSNRSDFMLTVNIMLPHVADDPTACPQYGPWHTQNEFNQTFNNSFVLIELSKSCKSQFVDAQKAGVLGFFVYGCPAEAPFFCNPNLEVFSAFSPNPVHLGVPLISISTIDGHALVQYLQAKRAEAVASNTIPPENTLTMTLKSSGPIVPEERAALVAIMQQTTMTKVFGLYEADLPTWSADLFSDLTYDPCLNRSFGIWCEGGHITSITQLLHSWATPATGAPTEFGVFTKMKYFFVGFSAWQGPLPDSMCAWTELRTLGFDDQFSSGVSSIPNCDWPLLEELYIQANHAVTSLPPKFSNWTKLKVVYGYDNLITSLPSVGRLTQLEIFDFAGNQIIGFFPDFSPFAPLRIVSLAANKLSGPIDPSLFDGMTTLKVLDLNSNRLTGPLPSFAGCTALQVLDLSQQRNLTDSSSVGFTGSMPSTWYTLAKLTKLSLQQNSLISPFTTSTLPAVTNVDLSHNNLAVIGHVTDYMISFIGPTLITLRLSYNQIAGDWGQTDQFYFQNLQKLYVDHNGLTRVTQELFATRMNTLDISYNNITTNPNDGQGDFTVEFAPQDTWVYLNLQGNPFMQYDDIPIWAVALPDQITQPGNLYSCHAFAATSAPSLTLEVDPTFHKYKYCSCATGTFGGPPACSYVPSYAELNPYHIMSSTDIGDSYSNLITKTDGVAGSQLTYVNSNNQVVPIPGFSDSMYGEDRLTVGMSTSWMVNLKNLFADDIDAYAALGEAPPLPIQTYQVDTTEAKPPAMTTPVRVITIRLHISATVMTSFDDVISVYEGGSDLKGTRVFTIRGTDAKPMERSSDYTSTPEYYHIHNASLSKVQDGRLIEIPVFTPEVTVQFTSRMNGGLHFYATYSYDFQCPQGYFYDTVTDPSTPQCRPNRVIYQIGSGIRAAVYAVSAITLAFVTFNLVVLCWKWNSLVYKAASRSFLVLTLILLECMALGALLYAAVPSELNSTGKSICIGRAWLTCLPLVGILGVLLAKNNRLDHIFGSTSLQVKVQTDFDILKVVIGVALGQILLLAFFTGLPLSRPELVLGKGNLSDKLVYQCSEESGFMSWLGAEIAYICALMLFAAYLGFRTRDLPSQYNESTHIQNAVILLMFFCVIIIPLDIFIQDAPESAVLIQGLGQAFLCLTLTAILFGPKLYYLTIANIRKRDGLGTGATAMQNTVMDPNASVTPQKKEFDHKRQSIPGNTTLAGSTPPTKTRTAGAQPFPRMTVATVTGTGGGKPKSVEMLPEAPNMPQSSGSNSSDSSGVDGSTSSHPTPITGTIAHPPYTTPITIEETEPTQQLNLDPMTSSPPRVDEEMVRVHLP